MKISNGSPLLTAVVIFTVGVIPPPPLVAGQDVTVVAGDNTYCGCEVQLEHVVTLGDASGPGTLLGEIRQVRRDSSGIYHVLAWNEYQIYRFDGDGRALSPLGSQGLGPGEFRQINNFLIVGDSIMAFDPYNARLTVLRPSGEVVRTIPIEGSVRGAVRFPGLGIVVNARRPETEAFGIPLHLIDAEGQRVRSFGGEGMVRLDAGLMWHRRMSRAGQGVWSAPVNNYAIERWTVDGAQTHSIERATDWFAPRLHKEWGGPDEPMKPWIADII